MTHLNTQSTIVILVIAYFIFRLLLVVVIHRSRAALTARAQAMAWDLYREDRDKQHAETDGKQSGYYGPG